MTFTTAEALRLVLDQVDYMAGACSACEMVGACLPARVIDIARESLRAEAAGETLVPDNIGDLLRGNAEYDSWVLVVSGPVCGNCATEVPPGCSGIFMDDGAACMLFRRRQP